jgi:hypothetical protein
MFCLRFDDVGFEIVPSSCEKEVLFKFIVNPKDENSSIMNNFKTNHCDGV